MPLYEMTGESLVPVPEKTFTELGLLERANIQRTIRAHIAAITPGVRTMVLAEEFGDWEGANRRIDLLCLDDMARLVVVELKRDNGAHMELQALRYAAMISAMRFDQAVGAHEKYLRSIGSKDDAARSIRKFLGLEDGQPAALSETVRIVLASSDFPQELTTTVLWLNKQGLDLRCVQMRPHLVDKRVLVDIQQVIPLPSAEQYQVALREKSMEQAAASIGTGKDYTRYDLTIDDATLTNMPKRRLIFVVVAEALSRGITPSQIVTAVPWRQGSLFVSTSGILDEEEFLAAFPNRSLDRYFTADDDLFHVGQDTYALSNQWGPRTLEAVEGILELLPKGISVDISATTPVQDEVTFEEFLIRQREDGAIEVERDGELVQPAKPTLRALATRLDAPRYYETGTEMNTRQLGAQLIKAIRAKAVN